LNLAPHAKERLVLSLRIQIAPVLPAQAEIQFASDTQATSGSRLRGNDGKHKKISINQAKLS
jgi:hypothetical protein